MGLFLGTLRKKQMAASTSNDSSELTSFRCVAMLHVCIPHKSQKNRKRLIFSLFFIMQGERLHTQRPR